MCRRLRRRLRRCRRKSNHNFVHLTTARLGDRKRRLSRLGRLILFDVNNLDCHKRHRRCLKLRSNTCHMSQYLRHHRCPKLSCGQQWLIRRRRRSRNSLLFVSLQVLPNSSRRHHHHHRLYLGMLPCRIRRSTFLMESRCLGS